jgi:pyruvate formate lyase activating enzyme
LQVLRRAREIAIEAGLHYVYTGNVYNPDGDATYCPGCGRRVIERDRYDILRYDLDDAGQCRHCGQAISGRFEHYASAFGSRRIPVRLAAAS